MPVLGRDVAKAAIPRESEYQIFDGEIPGLALRVNPSAFRFLPTSLSARAATGDALALSLECGLAGVEIVPFGGAR